MVSNLNIDKSINLLQEVRVLHALCDNGVTLHCDFENYQKLQPLIDFFNCNISLGFNPTGESFNNLVTIIHHEPTTKVGEHIRNLIFPKSLINFCQTENNDKLDEIYFGGLITDKRYNSINKGILKC